MQVFLWAVSDAVVSCFASANPGEVLRKYDNEADDWAGCVGDARAKSERH